MTAPDTFSLSTAALNVLAAGLGEPVIVTDARGVLTFANSAARERLGADKLIGLELGEQLARVPAFGADGSVCPPEDHPIARVLARRTTVAGVTLKMRGPDRAERTWLVSTVPIGAADALDGTVSVFREIDLVSAELTAEQLDAMDEPRLRAEVVAAREAAEEANRLKDDFIAALSHELRTPLQPILGWTEVLRRHGKLDGVTAQALEAIRRNIRQQVRLVDDLLDLSRIVHGKLSLRYETFDLRETVRAAAEPFDETAMLKRVRLTVSLPAEPALMWGDGARVQQIASNLMSNAVKFTRGGGHINVQLVVGETEALLEVEDDGEGIAPEDLPVIFEAFRQGGPGRRRGGLGIGLDLVKRLAELHGGTVHAFSDGIGYGARFVVRLPLGKHSKPSVVPAETVARRLDRLQILVVEDNVDTREVMKYMLECEGAEVVTAETGHEAVRVAQMFGPNVVLCDIGLPDIDGMEVARRIRRQGGHERMRLIALTGYGQPEDVQRALDAGFEAHLTKPINLDQLLGLLAEE